MNTEETIDPLGVVLRVDWALAQRQAEHHLAHRPAGRGGRCGESAASPRRQPAVCHRFIKNGDRWTVIEVGDRGGLRVRHQRSGKITWLAADYVRQHVDHAYAVTVHSAQGSTVDTAHVLVDGTEDRQTLYVALSRGRFGNHLYLRSAGDGDPHKTIKPEVVRPSTGAEILTAILERDGQEHSAATTRRLVASPQFLLRNNAIRYFDGILAAAEDIAGTDQLQAIETRAEQLQPGVTSCGGWPQLRLQFAVIAAPAATRSPNSTRPGPSVTPLPAGPQYNGLPRKQAHSATANGTGTRS